MNKNKKIFSILLFSFFITNFSSANNTTLDQVIVNVVQTFNTAPRMLLAFSFLAGLYLLGNAGYRLHKLGKDQQIRGQGIIGRIFAGVLLISILTAGYFMGAFINDDVSDAQNYYDKVYKNSMERTFNQKNVGKEEY